MRRKDLEKLPFTSVRGKVYVELDALVEALEAEEKAARAEEQPARALPRPADKPEKAG